MDMISTRRPARSAVGPGSWRAPRRMLNEWQADVELRAGEFRGENELAAEHSDPLPQRPGPDSTRRQLGEVIAPAEREAAAFVRHCNVHRIRACAERDGGPHHAGARMPPGVGESLLDDAVDLVAKRS